MICYFPRRLCFASLYLKYFITMKTTTMLTVMFLFMHALICIGHTSADLCPQRCHCTASQSSVNPSATAFRVNCSAQQITNISEVLSLLDHDTIELDLSRNLIRSLPLNPFSRLVNLTVLLLHENLIEELEPNTFKGLTNLRTLDLRRNRIKTIKSDAFLETTGSDSCDKLNVLTRPIDCGIDLTQNEIVKIERNAFAWTKKLSIYLGNSPVSLNIERYAFYGAHSITRLVISDVPSVNLGARLFTNVEGLNSLDVSNTHISLLKSFVFEGLKKARSIRFTNVSFTTIETYAFSGVQFIPSIVDVGKLGAPASRQSGGGGEIKFVKSSIQFLPTDAFRDTNLAQINISNCGIGLVQADAFRGMTALRNFYLSKSKVRELDSHGFGSFKNLDDLLFEDVDLGLLVKESFMDVSDIVNFRISVKSNLTIDTEAFSGCLNVRTLEISGTRPGIILNIRDGAFRNLVSVDQLIIRNLTLPLLEKGMFSGMTKIRNLVIENCNISEITPPAFGDTYSHQGAIENLKMDIGNDLKCGCQIVSAFRQLRYKFISYSATCTTEDGVVMEVNDDSIWRACTSSGNSLDVKEVILIVAVFLSFCFQYLNNSL